MIFNATPRSLALDRSRCESHLPKTREITIDAIDSRDQLVDLHSARLPTFPVSSSSLIKPPGIIRVIVIIRQLYKFDKRVHFACRGLRAQFRKLSRVRARNRLEYFELRN